MAIRRSYINWKPFTEQDRLESGKEYMVCSKIGDGKGELHFAKYYNAGDIVRLELRDGFPDGKKADEPKERLLEAIFGRKRCYTITEPGFYIMTADYGIDEAAENGSFEGCLEQPVCVGDLRPEGTPYATPCYWAERPVEPEGISYADADSGSRRLLTDKARQKADELKAEIEADSVLSWAYKGLLGDVGGMTDSTRVEWEYGGCCYSISPLTVARRLKETLQFARAAARVPKNEVTGVMDRIRGMGDEATRQEFLFFMQRHGIPADTAEYLCLYASALSCMDHGFSWHRDRILAQGGARSLNTPAVMQEAYYRSSYPHQLMRLVKFVGMDAPEIMLIKELRLCVGYETGWRDVSQIVSVVPERFPAIYGIYPDGSRYDKYCGIGDLELMSLPDPDTEDVEEEEEDIRADGAEGTFSTDCDGGIPGGDGEDIGMASGEGGVPVRMRYTWVYAPNFLMRQEGGPIFDCLEKKYMHDNDGHILLYSCRPEKELEALNSGLNP